MATHIVGGEMIYDYLGSDQYKITLKIYRDCGPGTAQFDGVGGFGSVPALITILEANGNVVGVYDIGSPVVTQIPPTINSPCIQTPNSVCVQEGIYTYITTLPPITGGYYIVYQRCCRNNSVLNLLQSGTQGSTYYTKIPGPEEVASNNSPRFKNFPPIFLCSNLDFSFDHSATDPDGDRLVYSLCAPFLGIDACCSAIGTGAPGGASPSCPSPPASGPNSAPPPPYSTVNFVAPYGGSYPIASNPSVTIDPNTGMLKGKPNLIGQFVVGVCVQEYRGNVLIGTHYRDFQFNIVPCVVSVISAVADQARQCQGNTINFTNLSTSNVGDLTYHWDFGVPNLSNDTSNQVNPTYTYQDTGKYVLTLVANPGRKCSDTLIKEVYVYPPLKIDFDPPARQCLKNNSFSFIPTGDFVPQAAFSWSFTASATPSVSSLKNPTGVRFDTAGLFIVKLWAQQFQCRDSTQDSVRVLPRPTARVGALTETLCDPATIHFRNTSSSDLPMQYYWSFSNGDVSRDVEPTEKFSPAGIYKATLMVVTQGVCADTSIAFIDGIIVRSAPIAAFTCSPQVASIFEPRIDIINHSSQDVYSWLYDFGDGGSSAYADETHFYQDYGNYVITQTVTTQFGCSSVTSHSVEILPEFRFWIPNSFTPDDNDLNELFMPIAIGVENYDFEIYDRWGQRIFKTSKPLEGWNGSFKGQPCKQDIYVWRITFKNVLTVKDEIHCGHVLLLRNQ